MPGEFIALGAKLDRLVSGESLRRVQTAAGMAAKDAANEVAGDALGSDRAMSNFRGGSVPLRSGFDIDANLIRLNLRPGGMWRLAEAGRRSSGRIFPMDRVQYTTRSGNVRSRRVRAAGGASGRALRTPFGPRAASSYGPSAGLKVITRTAGRAADRAPRAAFRALQREIGKVVG